MRLKNNRRGYYDIELSGVLTNKDYFVVDEVTYQALPLSDIEPYSGKGVNSTVFRAIRTDDSREYVVKVSNIPDSADLNPRQSARLERFRREIAAYQRVTEATVQQWVIGFLGAGVIEIEGKKFPCIVLDKADETLQEKLFEEEEELPLQQRLLICAELLRALSALHQIGIYHRDVKPENILFQQGVLKLVDLGLVAFRGEDTTIDGERERVGPIWWMAPEAVNKHLCARWASPRVINTTINESSDIYQLGKIFWFIIQGDIPNGHIKSKDMRVIGDDAFGTILKPLITYTASDRPSMQQISSNMNLLRRRYGF